jgi:hypothetical protein
MSLYAKRLERGRFIWPSVVDGVAVITPAQLGHAGRDRLASSGLQLAAYGGGLRRRFCLACDLRLALLIFDSRITWDVIQFAGGDGSAITPRRCGWAQGGADRGAR